VITVEDWTEIRHLHASQGMSILAIAKHLGIARGTVTAGPRCPVARAERPCPPREVPGALVQLLDGTRILADDLTDQHGRFRLQAPAGQFVVRATNVGAYRSTASHPVRLAPGTTTTVSLQLDTGIR
jgi:hypothetical protein